MRLRWPGSATKAIAQQARLAPRIERADRLGRVRHVAGIDVGFEDEGRTTRAAVAVLRADDMTLVDAAIARVPTRIPYIPGLLSYREIPAVLAALRRIAVTPDLLLCDGQGLAHPRRFGIACHLGLLLDRPAIGVAKSLLTGTHDPVPERRGCWRALRAKDEVIGAALRTRTSVAPVFVSIGHRVSLATAIDWTLRCTRGVRLPETTRWAHRLASGEASQVERLVAGHGHDSGAVARARRRL